MKKVPLGLLALVALAYGCSSTPVATLQLDIGGETAVFTRDPAPTNIEVDAVDSSGNRTTLYNGAISDSITLADEDQSTEAYLDLVATDATGAPVIRGRSLPVTFGALADTTLDLFVQRTGELARMPNDLDARESPLVDIVTGRFVLVAGNDASTTLYDVLSWSPDDTPPTFPTTPLSIAVSGTAVLLLDATTATSYDLGSSTSTAITAPTGGDFAEVLGGSAVYADDGTAYLVGATRATGDPTARVLKIGTDGTLSFVSLSSPRVGAAAVWIETRGVVVIGGSATAPGVEILGAGGTTAAPLAYPPVTGPMLSAASLGDGSSVVAGASPALYNLSCVSMCTPLAWKAPATTLVHADFFPLPNITTDILAIGWDMAGDTHVTRINAMSATDVPLKVARKHARGVALPNGAIGVVGGATQGESFIP